MGRPVKEGMRPLMPSENQELQWIVQATNERVDTVRRAKELLSVAVGKSRTATGQEANLSQQAVTQMVKRFNQRGLVALSIAAGRGRKLTYTREPQARIVAAVQRAPDRRTDQTATWSLLTLRQALRKEAPSQIARETIRQVLHAAGYSYQRTRTRCRTGYALRLRKSGTVPVVARCGRARLPASPTLSRFLAALTHDQQPESPKSGRCPALYDGASVAPGAARAALPVSSGALPPGVLADPLAVGLSWARWFGAN